MPTIREALALAIECHRSGRIPAAEEIYCRILAAEPGHAEAWHLRGVAAHQTGRHQEALEYIQRAIGLDAHQAMYHSNLGEVQRVLRDFPQAIASFRRALELRPEMAEIHYNLGNAYKDQGQPAEAVACYRRAIQLRPDHAQAYNNLGNTLKADGQPAEAIACLRRALELDPDFAEAYNNLGLAWQDQGELVEAIACLRRALRLRPDAAEFHSNLGNALREWGQPAEAIACYRTALGLRPDFAEAWYNLAYTFENEGQLSQAEDCLRRALQIQPDYTEARNNLGVALKDQGRLGEALACFREALRQEPEHRQSHSNLLLTMQYCEDVTPAELADAHRQFDAQHAAALGGAWPAHENRRDPQRRLRLGFLSPDFRRHPVGYFLVRVMEHLDPRQCETICYGDQWRCDELTARFQAAAGLWRSVASQSDERLAEQIRADGIDILFDLAGHTAHNRLLVFARRPAPIQITWLGYEGTTGLAAMDYLLADRQTVPEGAEQHYRERVLRMPEGYLCYEPPATAPPVGPLPAADRGYATFGSFNNLAKITPAVARVWAEILRRVPQSRLVLKYKGLGDEPVRQRYLGLFAACGVEPGRLELLPPSPFQEYLAAYGRIDVALDPFPFSGGATTCEALWMGVPVVTCPGQTFASRHASSHLASLGRAELIAGDLEQYVATAAELAGDLPRLAAIRGALRDQMAGAPLCDAERFAGDFTALMGRVWKA